MHRFFENENSLNNGEIYISERNLHHINVLRITENEEFEVVISEIVYMVKLKEISKDFAICEIISQKEDNNESNIKINLYQGLPKSDKFELIIQKAVELGVSKIIPFESSRTIVKWDAKKEKKKLIRYQEIASSAAKQSKRTIIPEVLPLVLFNEMVNEIKDKFTVIAYENRGITLKEILLNDDFKEINIIIGPEGGFSEVEVEKIESAGANVVNLGNRILRTETAAIALISMIQYEKGDINLK